MPFQIDTNAAEIVKNRLKLEKDLGPLREIIQQMMTNPKAVNADLVKNLEGVKVDDNIKDAFRDMLKNDPTLKSNLENWITNNQSKIGKTSADAKKSLAELKQMLRESDRPTSKVGSVDKKSDHPKQNQGVKPQETLAKATENFLKKAENTQLRDWLQNSPAWQRAFDDLRTSLENPRAAKWKPGDWPSKLLTPGDKTWKLGEKAL